MDMTHRLFTICTHGTILSNQTQIIPSEAFAWRAKGRSNNIHIMNGHTHAHTRKKKLIMKQDPIKCLACTLTHTYTRWKKKGRKYFENCQNIIKFIIGVSLFVLRAQKEMMDTHHRRHRFTYVIFEIFL